ncbi:MAG TPA: YkgJ family cysteine cluster protein [Polyangia bacterium]|nr:YkgJ family cysteine cluster protein [Polyangia bacterium]
MDADDLYRAVAAALKRAHDAEARSDGELAEVRARLAQLVALLEARGAINDGHVRAIDRAGERARAAERPKVRLRQYVDKYQVPGGDIDCEARLHLCHARCCAFSFELSAQDLDEGVVRWELEQPYVIRHEADGYCTHVDRKTLGCTIYAKRPAACRGFDCRGDARVWLDFDARIPAPMPGGLQAPER